MKTKLFLRSLALSLAIICACALQSFAQSQDTIEDFYIVRGVIRDADTRKGLPNVSIIIAGTGTGTVSNTDGGFSVKVRKSSGATSLHFVHIGFLPAAYELPGDGQPIDDAIINMRQQTIAMDGITVRHGNPRELVKQAAGKISANYSDRNTMLTGFYRETIRKRNNYTNVTEAIVNIFKTPYGHDDLSDRVQVLKGRRVISPKLSDTLHVKLQGGPSLSIHMDLVKARDVLLADAALDMYDFQSEEPAMIDGRLHYVIRFYPRVSAPYPLMYGMMYIDQETLSFSRIACSVDMSDEAKVTTGLLRKKPPGLVFKTEKVDYLVTYKNYGGITYFNYVRSDMQFRCDWRKRLFSTAYTVVSEMVITDIEPDASRIPWRNVFQETAILSDKVGDFYDGNFWEDYNIIEPTESLESAVNRLRRINKRYEGK